MEILKSHLSGTDKNVTINSDDVLIFDSDVSKEYLRLYQSECLTAEELDAIRLNGLKDVKKYRGFTQIKKEENT
ncbi:MAG: hypothetical protein K6D38_04525 [Pseudobutyrivibrio sp.]|nr:hypothetical protein [Pseudobutyrivibrio sp.]